MPAPGVVGYLTGSVDSAIQSYVTTTSAAISLAITPLVVTGMSIWVLTYGFAVMRNEVQDPVMVFVKNVTTKALIFAVALSTGVYQDIGVTGVQELQNGLVTIVMPNAGGDIYSALDQYDDAQTLLVAKILGYGLLTWPAGGGLVTVAAVIVFIACTALMLLFGGFLLVVKIAMAFVIAIGPMFIASLAFPPLTKFFEAWTAKVINYVLLSMGFGFIMGVAIRISQGYVDSFMTDFFTVNMMSNACGLIFVNGAFIIVALQMPQIASGLAGGASISGGGFTGFIAGAVARRLGIPQMPKGGGGSGGGGSLENKSESKPTNRAHSAGQKVAAYQRATRDRLQ